MKNTSRPTKFSPPFIEHIGSATSATPFYAIAGKGRQDNASSSLHEQEKKVGHKTGKMPGIALTGLRKYSPEQLGPASQENKKCRRAVVVTRNLHKAEEWRHQYALSNANIYNDQNFERYGYQG